MRSLAALLTLLGLIVAACSGGGSGGGDDEAEQSGLENAGDCIVVDIAVSSEKIDLMRRWPRGSTRRTRPKVGDRCVFVRPQTQGLRRAPPTCWPTGWDDATEGPRPVIWSPAASSWGAILNQRLADDGQAGDGRRRRLVHAHPARHRHAEADGRRPRLPGRARSAGPTSPASPPAPEGWAAYGHPEWGAFKLGKTNPNFSTSGLSALIAQAYAATGKTRDLSSEDLDAAEDRRVRHAASSRRSSTTATSR